jgi:hypothetical protein
MHRHGGDRAWLVPVLLDETDYTRIPGKPVGQGRFLPELQWVSLFDDWNGGVRKLAEVTLRHEKKVLQERIDRAGEDAAFEFYQMKKAEFTRNQINGAYLMTNPTGHNYNPAGHNYMSPSFHTSGVPVSPHSHSWAELAVQHREAYRTAQVAFDDLLWRYAVRFKETYPVVLNHFLSKQSKEYAEWENNERRQHEALKKLFFLGAPAALMVVAALAILLARCVGIGQ